MGQRGDGAIFPLGVKKDEDVSLVSTRKADFRASRSASKSWGFEVNQKTYSDDFPTHLDEHDISMKFAGAGGDGAQTVAMLASKTAVTEGFDSTHIPSYGPESRGGTSYADIHIAREEVCLRQPRTPCLGGVQRPESREVRPTVQPGGTVIYDSSVISSPPIWIPRSQKWEFPCTEIAMDLGAAKVKNVVALGALQAATQIFPTESFLATIRKALAHNCAMIELNEEAFSWGIKAFEEVSGYN